MWAVGWQVLLVLDGTTGLNMLNQAREFNKQMALSGLILTKLDGTSRGGCVVCALSPSIGMFFILIRTSYLE